MRLRELHELPEALFLTGSLPGPPYVAVVGTRHPSESAVRFATELARDLSRAGVCVLSGGAEGIDAAAHRGALGLPGGTLVVAPGGWYKPFPPELTELFHEVVDSGGGYLSICAPRTPATRARFFLRNACLVALAQAVVVVEAGFRSGARNAAKHARVLGRKLFVVPSAPWIGSGRGCILELKAGATPLDSVGDVLAYLASIQAHALGNQVEVHGAQRRAQGDQVEVHGVQRGAQGVQRRAQGVQRKAQGDQRSGRGGQQVLPLASDLPDRVGEREDAPVEAMSGASDATVSELASGAGIAQGARAGEGSRTRDRVLAAVRAGAATVDDICAATGLTVPEVQYQVFDLRVEGVVALKAGGVLQPVGL